MASNGACSTPEASSRHSQMGRLTVIHHMCSHSQRIQRRHAASRTPHGTGIIWNKLNVEILLADDRGGCIRHRN